ncbi:MAG TPA: nuclear transport factor 2 family protein [Steroidobacteraceae bacterium]|nr:nuclear transport factor 2 family protein [Steroidobacteraceae bacterium]
MPRIDSFALKLLCLGVLIGAAGALALEAYAAPVASDNPSTLTDLTSRVQIEQLIHDYYSCLSSDCRSSHPSEGSFYTPDGVNNVNGYIAQGPQAINAQYKFVATQEVLPRGKFDMMITNLVIAVHGGSATAEDMWTGVSSLTPESTPQFVEMGHEYSALVKVDGRWYFKTRHIVSDAGLPQMFVKTYSSR